MISVGQELTARTKHTGVVRKRVMPLCLSVSPDNAPSLAGATILNASGKNVGRVVAAYPRMSEALGLVRFAIALQAPEDLRIPTSNDLRVGVRTPDWWPEDVMRIAAGQDEAAAAASPAVKTDGGPPKDSFSISRSS
jgi:folate-binding Fe-S cluster repair protein YgfZ